MTVGIVLGVIGGVAAALFATWHGMSYYYVDKKCERPKFQLLRTFGEKKKWFGLKTVPAVELRRYAPMLIAQVILERDDMRQAMNNGFRQIAAFIFGQNVADNQMKNEKVEMTAPVALEIADSKNQKIEMTAPVTSEFIEGQKYQIAFVMPSKYTKETLPKPINQNIKIREVQGHTMAAMGWNGSSPSRDQTEQKSEQLRKLLQREGLRPKGNIHLYQYHPPFSPPWMRLNQVLYEIEE